VSAVSADRGYIRVTGVSTTSALVVDGAQCGAADGTTRTAGDGSVCDCVCNLPANHAGPHRFWGLRRREAAP
jgi:hypothetical protein